MEICGTKANIDPLTVLGPVLLEEFEPETDLNKRIIERKRTSKDISRIPLALRFWCARVIWFEACSLQTKVHRLLSKTKLSPAAENTEQTVH